MSERRSAIYALIGPAWLWLTLFFVLPLGLMAIISLRPDTQGGFFAPFKPTLAQYQATFEGEGYMYRLGLSLQVALIVSLVGTLLAYPLAYFLVFRAGPRGPLLLTLAILPFWTSYLLRVIAWKIILGPTGPINGTVNNLLMALHLTDEPVRILLYSRAGVIVTLIYVWLPFVALPIYAALQRIDKSLLEAAANLGASPWLAFLRVTLPLSLPGVIAAFIMVFVPTVGEYIAPLLVGGSNDKLYGNFIEQFFNDGNNLPRGSAMAFIMLIGVMVLLAILPRFVDRKQFAE